MLVLAGPESDRADAVVADVSRVRQLHQFDTEAVRISADPSTECGARAIVESVMEQTGRIDVLVHGVEPPPGSAAMALASLLPMFQSVASVLAQASTGRIILGLDLDGGGQRPWSTVERDELGAAFETLIRSGARAHFAQHLCINGLFLDHKGTRAQDAFLLAAGRVNGFHSPSPHTAAYSAAAGVSSLLASIAGCGITGQVFRFGTEVPRTGLRPDIAPLLAKSVRVA